MESKAPLLNKFTNNNNIDSFARIIAILSLFVAIAGLGWQIYEAVQKNTVDIKGELLLRYYSNSNQYELHLIIRNNGQRHVYSEAASILCFENDKLLKYQEHEATQKPESLTLMSGASHRWIWRFKKEDDILKTIRPTYVKYETQDGRIILKELTPQIRRRFASLKEKEDTAIVYDTISNFIE